MAYDLFFRRLNIFLGKDKDLVWYAMKKTFALCNINLLRLNFFVEKNASNFTISDDKARIDEIFRDFKQQNH
jgi:hypothetical protein